MVTVLVVGADVPGAVVAEVVVDDPEVAGAVIPMLLAPVPGAVVAAADVNGAFVVAATVVV